MPPVALALPPVTVLPPWSVDDSFDCEPLEESFFEPPFDELSFDCWVSAVLSTLALPPVALALPPLPPVALPL